MKLWVDDVRRPPSNEWIWVQSVNQAIGSIYEHNKHHPNDIIIIDLDHDADDYFFRYGGGYIKILNWLEQQGIVNNNYLFHIHSMNPVGVQNMRTIIQHNGWREIYG